MRYSFMKLQFHKLTHAFAIKKKQTNPYYPITQTENEEAGEE